MSISSKNSLAITDLLAEKNAASQLFRNPLPGNLPVCDSQSCFSLVFYKAGWFKTGLSKQGYGSSVAHAWWILRSCVLVPWESGWIYIAVNDRHCYSMSLVWSWNEVGDVLCQVSSSPFCTRPFWRMPSFWRFLTIVDVFCLARNHPKMSKFVSTLFDDLWRFLTWPLVCSKPSLKFRKKCQISK